MNKRIIGDKMEFVKYYRVQGGNGYSKSRQMLRVTDANVLDLDMLKKIHIGSEEHNKNFLKLRLSEKWKKYAGVDLNNNDSVNVVEMYFPIFFRRLLQQCAISEYENTGKNPKALPHTVDISKGEAYAVYGAWNGIMKACCMYATDNVIVNEDDTKTLYENNEQIIQKFHPIDLVMLKKFLNHAKGEAKISSVQIDEIIKEAEKYNAEMIKYKGENVK